MPRSTHSIGRVSYLSLLVFFVLLLLVALVLAWARVTEKPDTLIHDLWAHFDNSPPPEDVVIVAIDSTSLHEVGRWPWSRDIQAALIEKLTHAGVRSVAMDILLTERDRESAANDFLLSQAIAENGRVILPILTGEYIAGNINPELLPIPEMTLATAGLGHVFLPLDPDGIVRRVYLKSGFKAPHWSTLSLALAELTGEAPVQLPGLRMQDDVRRYSWMADHQVMIPFYGEGGSFRTVSASQVLQNEVPLDQLQGKHVFVGVTAVGLGDIHPTPVSSSEHPMSGVEIHATVFAGLRDGRLVTETGKDIDYLIIPVLLLIIIFFYVRFSPSIALSGAFLIAFVPVVISFFLYMRYRLWYPPLTASIPILTSFPVWSWHRLQFVSGFIQEQIDEMDSENPTVSSSDSDSLASYLDACLHHLPLKGWKFISDNKIYHNGALGLDIRYENTGETWKALDSYYYKSYKSTDRLFICLNISDARYAGEITHMIDSLSRVRDRQVIDNRIDTVERLQIKAQQLSSRMENLRRVNVVSESIFHGSPAGLAVWNMAGEFVRMNELAHDMLPEVLGKEPEFRVFLRGIGRDPDYEDAASWRALLMQKTPWQIEYDVPGEEKIIDFSVIGESFADRLLVASIVDVSAIRESERARAEMMEFLSHDLRSPLISSVYLLSGQQETASGENLESLERIESNINRSLGMIDDLLNLSRADNLKQEELEPVLFDNIVNNSIDQVMPQAQGKSIAIVLEENEEDEFWVKGNAILLERALINVLGNAIKYSPEQTRIRVRVFVQNNHIVCEVIDQGIGMDEAKIATLFQRFKRDESVERGYQGTGLGLALVARVIQQHRGSVRAESPGKGTRVVIELPLDSEVHQESFKA